jgi:hypothetical protein
MHNIYYIMINIIYGLRDPRNDVYQYIGKSTVGNKRALTHLTKSHSSRVNEWVKQLGDNWLYPQIDIIEEVENLEDLPEREKYWIGHYYNLNPDLLNIDYIPKIVETRTDEDQEIFQLIQNKIFDIPQILRKERIYRKLTQAEMAKHMGVNRGTVSLIENGHNVGFSLVQKYFLTLKGFDILTKVDSQRVRK